MVFTRLYLCRHGEVVGDGRRRYNGHRDVDINENGVRQMELLRERLKDAPISAVYASDLIRTVRGARIIAEPHGIEVSGVPEFRERGVGLWEGMAWEEIEQTYPDDWKAWLGDIVHYQPKGGESLLQVRARVMPALHSVLEENREREILLVAHGGVNRIILSEAMKLDMKNVFRIEQGYGRLNIIDFYEDGMSVVKLLNG